MMHKAGKSMFILTFASAAIWSDVAMSADIDTALLKQCEDPVMQAPDRLILFFSTKSRYTRAEQACVAQLNKKLYLQHTEEKYRAKQNDENFRRNYAVPAINQDLREQIDATNSIFTVQSNSGEPKAKNPIVKTVKGYTTILE